MDKTESSMKDTERKGSESEQPSKAVRAEYIDVDKLFDAVGAELELAKRRANFTEHVRNMCRIMRLILLRIEKFEELCQYERSGYLHPDVLQKAKRKFREHANQPTSSW